MIYICPKCGAIAEWNAYYGRYTCTRCTYEAQTIARQEQRQFDYDNQVCENRDRPDYPIRLK